MKKLLAFTLSIIMLLSLSLPAYAAESISDPYSYTVTINEYDVYVATRTASASDLAKAGISARHADLIKSNAIENELLQLSALSSEMYSQIIRKTELRIHIPVPSSEGIIRHSFPSYIHITYKVLSYS